MSLTKTYEDLIKEFHPMIYKICRVYSSEDDFDDLYQEILISLWRSFKTFKGHSKLSTWVYRVVLNTALTYQRNTRKTNIFFLRDSLPEVLEEVDDRDEKESQVGKMYIAISKLKKNDRSLVLLYLEEKTYDEIAEITGLSSTNVGVKINRLKKRLLNLLNSIE